VGTFLSEVIASLGDARKFQDLIKLVNFSPFKSAQNTLDNINDNSEVVITKDLINFAENIKKR
jgi:nucleolar protein 56